MYYGKWTVNLKMDKAICFGRKEGIEEKKSEGMKVEKMKLELKKRVK